jgi:cytochrome c oxidase subunit 2
MHSPVRRKLLVSTWTLLALALVWGDAAALAGNGGIAPPDPASPNAERSRDAYWIVLVFTGAIFVLVEGLLVAFVLRYRGRNRPREVEGPQVIGHNRLELIWTVVPVLILVAIGGFVFYKLPGIRDIPEAGAAGPNLEVKVEGRQFYWRFVYPNGVVAVNELRVPAGRVVELELTAPAHDVIHSWWVPRLGGKLDAIPGETNRTWFQAKKPGLYRGQCTEYCGAQHALMLATVRVLRPIHFETWLYMQAIPSGGPSPALGEQTFAGACAPCHGENGQGLIGPPLEGRAPDAEQIERIVRNGQGTMPAVGKGWDGNQMAALIDYVRREFGPQGAQGGG